MEGTKGIIERVGAGSGGYVIYFNTEEEVNCSLIRERELCHCELCHSISKAHHLLSFAVAGSALQILVHHAGVYDGLRITFCGQS